MSDPAAIDAEENLLGSILVKPAYLSGVLSEVRLHADHFYLDRNGRIFAAAVGLYDQQLPVDEITVGIELERRGHLEDVGGRGRLSELASTVAAPGHALHHARIIAEKADWRQKRRAAQALLAACDTEDAEKVAEAEEILAQDLAHPTADYSPQRQADVAYAMLDQGGVETFPYCFDKLNRITAGGIARGEMVVIAAHTSFGKSILTDQILEACARRGARCRLYMNEMAVDERLARSLARKTGVPNRDILQGTVTEDGRRQILTALNEGFAYPITDAAGWSGAEVCHHIRAHREDVVAIDILQEFDYRDERDLSRMVSGFARTAKQADCGLILVSHLNEKRVDKPVRPKPTLGDLRGSGQIKNAADTVLFLHRKQEQETGEPLDEGAVYFGKVRRGSLGGMPVEFDRRRIRFRPAT